MTTKPELEYWINVYANERAQWLGAAYPHEWRAKAVAGKSLVYRIHVKMKPQPRYKCRTCGADFDLGCKEPRSAKCIPNLLKKFGDGCLHVVAPLDCAYSATLTELARSRRRDDAPKDQTEAQS